MTTNAPRSIPIGTEPPPPPKSCPVCGGKRYASYNGSTEEKCRSCGDDKFMKLPDSCQECILNNICRAKFSVKIRRAELTIGSSSCKSVWQKLLELKEDKLSNINKSDNIEFITELHVVRNEKGQLVWKIIRRDADEESVGEITVHGVPAPAKSLPAGTTYRTIFTIPNEKIAV